MTTENEMNQGFVTFAFATPKPKTPEALEEYAQAELAALSPQILALATRGDAIKKEKDELEAALRAAEGRMSVLSAETRDRYVSARDELAAKALLTGEAVDLDSVPDTDNAANMSVSDIQGGIRALQRRRASLTEDLKQNQKDHTAKSLEFCRLYGLVQACRLIAAKAKLADAVCGLMAAQQKTFDLLGDETMLRAKSSLLPFRFDEGLYVPMVNEIGALHELEGFDKAAVQCGHLRTTGRVAAAGRILDAAMLGGAA